MVIPELTSHMPVYTDVWDIVGIIPSFLNEDDPRPAREQFNSAYISGWSPVPGFRMGPDYGLRYPDDPVMMPKAMMKLRKEIILVYESGWVAIIQPDKSWEVARLD